MADQVITPIECTINALTQIPPVGGVGGAEALTAANDGIFAPPKDGKYLILIRDAAGGQTITVKAGTSAIKNSRFSSFMTALLRVNRATDRRW